MGRGLPLNHRGLTFLDIHLPVVGGFKSLETYQRLLLARPHGILSVILPRCTQPMGNAPTGCPWPASAPSPSPPRKWPRYQPTIFPGAPVTQHRARKYAKESGQARWSARLGSTRPLKMRPVLKPQPDAGAPFRGKGRCAEAAQATQYLPRHKLRTSSINIREYADGKVVTSTDL